MKAGMPIDEFVAEIHRLDQTKQDIIVPTTDLFYHAHEGEEFLTVRTSEEADGRERFKLTKQAAEQVSDRVNIPKVYRERMLAEAPGLMTTNVNHWFVNKPERRMVRLLDGNARAFLSDRYARIDHVDVLRAIEQPLSHLQAEFGARIESAEITEKKMYVKVVVPGIEADLGSERNYGGQHTGTYYGGQAEVGDIVQAGFVIENSEVGSGAFTVKQMIFRVACKNGLIRGETLRKTHLGGRITDTGYLWADDTREAEDRVVLLAARDVVNAAVDETRFQAVVAQMRDAKATEPTMDPLGTITRLGKTHGLSDGEGQLVLSCFMKDATSNGLGLYGLVNAVTAASQQVGDYERATEFESLGGVLLDADWNTLAGVK